MIPPLEGWIVASDAAELLGLTRQSINKKIRNNVFPGARRIGSQYVLPEEEVEAERSRRDD
jgi:excisionase family DNA binding protein